MTIGDRLKELRERSGLTQKQAAARVGMQQQAWRVYETGASMPGATLIMKICGEYDCSADWLLGMEHEASISAAAPDCKHCPHLEKLRKLEDILGK